MQTQNFVKANATIITITTLEVGNVYVRLEEDSTYNESQLKYGVVTQVMHNGEDAIITAIERSKSQYGNTIEVNIKVFKTADNLKLFHADPVTFRTEMDKLTAAFDRQVTAARKELQGKIDQRARFEQTLLLTLTEPTHSVGSMSEIETVDEAVEGGT